jgi:hypothetical protein
MAEGSAIESFKAANDPCIAWLNKGSHIRVEKFNVYISWLVGYIMAGKVVDQEVYMTLVSMHLDIKLFDSSA